MAFYIQAVGDSAVKIQFKGNVTPALNQVIQLFCKKLQRTAIRGVIEWVPAYDSVTIYYKPWLIRYDDLCREINAAQNLDVDVDSYGGRHIDVPVVYGGAYGPDLERVAALNHLDEEEVVRRHTARNYLIYMLGFLPGFPYLGGLDQRIAAPRHADPRAQTPAGGVGIADEQTGIYPTDSPGGWNIIGRTPIQLFDMTKTHPTLFAAGDRIHFYAVTGHRYNQLKQQVEHGTYEVEVRQDD